MINGHGARECSFLNSNCGMRGNGVVILDLAVAIGEEIRPATPLPICHAAHSHVRWFPVLCDCRPGPCGASYLCIELDRSLLSYYTGKLEPNALQFNMVEAEYFRHNFLNNILFKFFSAKHVFVDFFSTFIFLYFLSLTFSLSLQIW